MFRLFFLTFLSVVLVDCLLCFAFNFLNPISFFFPSFENGRSSHSSCRRFLSFLLLSVSDLSALLTELPGSLRLLLGFQFDTVEWYAGCGICCCSAVYVLLCAGVCVCMYEVVCWVAGSSLVRMYVCIRSESMGGVLCASLLFCSTRVCKCVCVCIST